MIHVTCDRCNVETEEETRELGLLHSEDNGGDGDIECLVNQICQTCIAELRDWLAQPVSRQVLPVDTKGDQLVSAEGGGE
jgi:hypothetical protein